MSLILCSLGMSFNPGAIASPTQTESATEWTRKSCELPEHLEQWGLTVAQGEAICKAAPGYDIDLFFGRGKTIVIVGERHHSPLEIVSQGQELLNQFPFRGTEGFPSPHFHDEIVASLRGTDDQASISTRIIKALDWGIYKLLNKTDSLIRRAKIDGIYLFFDGQGDYLRVRGGRPKLYSKELDSSDSKNQSEALPISVNLERDSRVIEDIWDHCSDGFKKGKSLPQNCPDEYLIEKRNEGLLSGLASAFEFFPDETSILILVGAKHLDGLRNNLICKQGFDYRPLTRGLSLTKELNNRLNIMSLKVIREHCSEQGLHQ